MKANKKFSYSIRKKLRFSKLHHCCKAVGWMGGDAVRKRKSSHWQTILFSISMKKNKSSWRQIVIKAEELTRTRSQIHLQLCISIKRWSSSHKIIEMCEVSMGWNEMMQAMILEEVRNHFFMTRFYSVWCLFHELIFPNGMSWDEMRYGSIHFTQLKLTYKLLLHTYNYMLLLEMCLIPTEQYTARRWVCVRTADECIDRQPKWMWFYSILFLQFTNII